MTRIAGLAAVSAVLLFAFDSAQAQDADGHRDERRAAQKERQVRKNERNEEIKDATRAFRDYVRELRMEYRDRVNDLETEFELKRVELRADHDARISEAEAEHRKKLSEMLMQHDGQLDKATIEDLQIRAKAFSDELYELRKEAAEALHRARIEKEERRNAILTEQDRMALEKASALGLTQGYSPILATSVGEGLTPKEERWNEQERKEVLRLEEKNAKLLNEYATGEALREWQIEKLEEDFKLEWQEKAELHALESSQLFYNALLMQTAQGGSFDQKEFTNRMADLAKQKQLVKSRYKEIRDRNRIERRQEKNELLAY